MLTGLCVAGWLSGKGLDPGLTQVSLQPLVAFDELVNQCKVVGVGLIRHNPAARDNLQLPVPHQPAEEGPLILSIGCPVLASQPHRAGSWERRTQGTNVCLLFFLLPLLGPGPASLRGGSLCFQEVRLALSSLLLRHLPSLLLFLTLAPLKPTPAPHRPILAMAPGGL